MDFSLNFMRFRLGNAVSVMTMIGLHCLIVVGSVTLPSSWTNGQEELPNPAMEESPNGVLVLDGKAIRFIGIPQSTVNQWGEEKLNELRLNRRERKLIADHYKQEVRVDLQGSIQLTLTPKRRKLGVVPFVNFLCYPKIQDDLLFTKDQQGKLQTIESSLIRAHRAYSKATENRLQNPNWDRRRVLESLEKAHQLAASELQDLMLPHQFERVQQLLVRAQIREFGLATMLVYGGQIHLTPEQKSSLFRRINSNRDQLRLQSSKLRRQVIRALSDQLTDKQQGRLQKWLGAELERVRIPIGILWAQLEPQSFETPNHEQGPHDELFALAISDKFEFDEFHQFQLTRADKQLRIYRYGTCVELSFILGGRVFPNPIRVDYVKELELSENQIAVLQKIHPAIQSTYRQIYEQQPHQDESAEDFQERLHEESRAAFQALIEKQYEVLNLRQKSRLSKILRRILVSRIGPLNALLNSEWKSELRLSKQQADQLKIEASRLRKQIAKKATKMEEEFRRTVLAELSKPQQRQLAMLLGEPVENTMSNLDLIYETIMPETIEHHLSNMKADLDRSVNWLHHLKK